MIKKLTKREKYAVYAMAGAIFLFMVMQFVVFPSIDKRKRLKRELQLKTNALREMIALKSDYGEIEKSARASSARFASREKGFTLFSFLDRLTGEARIKEYVTYMKPSTTVQRNSPYKISQVEMKIQGLTLQQLTTYMYMIETSKNMIRVRRLSIVKAGKAEGYIDAVLQVETLEKS